MSSWELRTRTHRGPVSLYGGPDPIMHPRMYYLSSLRGALIPALAVGSGAALRVTWRCRTGAASSYCRRGYPCFKVPTVAPEPTSGEGASLQMGPKLASCVSIAWQGHLLSARHTNPACACCQFATGHTNRSAGLHGRLARGPHAWRFGRAPHAWGALLAPPMLRISSGSGPEATWERARWFASPAHGCQRLSHVTCGSGPLSQWLSCSGARCASDGFFQGARGAFSWKRGFSARSGFWKSPRGGE
jgi:hypothetical protein